MRIAPMSSVSSITERPSPPDVGEITDAVKSELWNWPAADQQTAASAALRGGRTGEETVTILGGIKSELWNWSRDLAGPVMVAGLSGPYDAQGVVDAVATVKRDLWNRPQSEQAQLMIDTIGGRRRP